MTAPGVDPNFIREQQKFMAQNSLSRIKDGGKVMSPKKFAIIVAVVFGVLIVSALILVLFNL